MYLAYWCMVNVILDINIIKTAFYSHSFLTKEIY